MIFPHRSFWSHCLLFSSLNMGILFMACNKKDSTKSVSEFKSAGTTNPLLIEYSVDFSKKELTIPKGSSNELQPDGFTAANAKVSSAVKSGCAYDIRSGTYKITAEGTTVTSITGLDPRLENPDPKLVIPLNGTTGEFKLSENANERYMMTFTLTGPAIVIGCTYYTR